MTCDSILDCDNSESAICSLAHLYSVDVAKLILTLQSYTPDLGNGILPSDYRVEDYVNGKLGKPRTPEGVCWFHFTALLAPRSYEEGLLPTEDCYRGVINDLICALQNDVLRRKAFETFRGEMRHVEVKIAQEKHMREKGLKSGPYGYLVRETGCHRKLCGRFTSLPEIVCDFCTDFELDHGESIRENLKALLVPYVVKFIEYNHHDDDRTIKSALNFAYATVRRLPATSDFVCCFVGEGRPVRGVLDVMQFDPEERELAEECDDWF